MCRDGLVTGMFIGNSMKTENTTSTSASVTTRSMTSESADFPSAATPIMSTDNDGGIRSGIHHVRFRQLTLTKFVAYIAALI